ncbi:hypothetical protein [Streptomyces sp. t39]|uniref:hypothetical protein n=1 Tax=Streptomyces sp. t39 TaxID=1828156 RepID=UPI0021CA0334|nr:hypothetical protein [Streptomyces sp. t39]
MVTLDLRHVAPSPAPTRPPWARSAWRIEQARAHAGLPKHAPDTTLVVGHWAFQGSGYSPGGALLAAHVWHRRELERRFIAEEGC